MEAHYRCAVTDEVLPESELLRVAVYKLHTHGTDRFSKEKVGAANIEESLVHSSYTGIDVLTAFDELVMVYKEDRTYGTCFNPDEMDEEEISMWNQVAARAKVTEE